MNNLFSYRKAIALAALLLVGTMSNLSAVTTIKVGSADDVTNNVAGFTTIQAAYNSITTPVSDAYEIVLLAGYEPTAETYPITLGSKAATISVTTTANSTSATITNAGTLTNGTYTLCGGGIVAGTTFTYSGSTAVTLSKAATVAGTSVTMFAVNSVTIRPATGVNVTLAGSANTTGIFTFDGAKYVTIDGQSGGTGGTKNLTITNPNTAASANTIKLQNDASYNTIKYCTVTGSAASTTSAPATGTIFIGSTANTLFSQTGAYPNLFGSGNHYNTIDNCDITDNSAGLPTVGVYDYGYPNNSYGNYGTTISNCNISNCFNPGAFYSAGVYTNYSFNVNVNNNKIYQTGTRTYTADGGVNAGIYCIYPMWTATNNIIGYSNNNQTGTYTIAGGKSCRFVGMYFQRAFNTPTANTTSCIGNTVANIDITTSSPGTAISTSSLGGTVTGIYVANNFWPATPALPNQVHDITVRPSVTTTAYSTLCGVSVCAGSNSMVQCTNIYNLNVIPSSATVSGILVGVYNAGTNQFTIKQNQIYNLTCSTVDVNSSVTQTVSGIVSGAGGNAGNAVERNLVYNLKAYTSSTPTVVGIQSTGNSLQGVVFKNNIVRVATDVVADATVYGMYQSANTAANKVYFYNNSVYVGGAAPASATKNTFAFYSSATAATTGNNDLQNNIFVNQRSIATGGTPTAKNYAIGYTTASVIKTCNNNLYWATPLGSAAATDKSDLDTWKNTVVSGSDAASISGTPNFVDPTASTPDLRIIVNTSTVNAVGADLSSSVADDFFGSARSGLTPHDLGAYAFTPSGVAGPTIEITSTTAATTASNPIPVTITLSEAVTGFTLSDLTVGNGTAGNLQGSGAVYTVDITPASSQCTVTLDIAANVAVNTGLNGNSAATQFSRNYDFNTKIATNNSELSSVYASNNSIVINRSIGQRVTIYSVAGQILKSFVINDTIATVPMEKGYYIVSIGNRQTKVIVK